MKYPIKDLITDKLSGEWGNEPVDGEGYKVIRTTNFTNYGIIDYEKIVVRDIDAQKVDKKHLKNGDIIIEKSGGSPAQPVGRVVFFDLETDEKFLCNNFTTILRPNKDLVVPKYFFYQLHIAYQRGKTKRYQNKTTGIINLQLDKYLEEKIEVPSLPDQLHIANILSKAENLIAQRKESICLLDEFLKSTFLEMFGDPIRNKKNWKLLQVSDYGESRLGKMLDGKKIIGNNLKPYLRNSNVLWFGFKLDDLLEMDFDEKDKIEFSLRNGDILMCEGGEIGRCAIWRDELEECYFQKAIHRIRLNENIALPEYFVYMFWLYTSNGGLNKYMGAATISHLTGEKLKKMKLPIPPIKLQTQFAQIVEKTETIKTQYQQSLRELENLYGSLSQKAFRGNWC